MYKKIKYSFLKLLKNYTKDKSGVVAIVFGLSLPVLVAASGVAVDLGQAYNIKNRLGNAIDKAALAVAASTGEEDELNDIMNAFMDANYPEEKIGVPYGVILTMDGEKVTITANAKVDTKFMRVFGKDEVNVVAKTEVIRDLSGIEVVLVLDVTGSMYGSRLSALKQASLDFIEVMYDRITDEEYLKIGIVPYASSVNVGSYGWGLDTDGNNYGTAFVTTPDTDDYISPPSDIEYDLSDSEQWHGCVLAKDYPEDTQNIVSNPVWEMYRFPEICLWSWYGYCYYWISDPNYYCPSEQVVPLTNDRNTLEDTINGLEAMGFTYGNIGMLWGGRVISPEEPFTEGEDWDDPRWRKAILMMTDGNNTMHYYYSVYGLTYEHSITPSDLNERFEETCENLKGDGVQIYTITFGSGISEDTKGYYERCASDTSLYFDAPSNETLVQAFQEIANQLSKLHISK